jgi:hypothetical protein
MLAALASRVMTAMSDSCIVLHAKAQIVAAVAPMNLYMPMITLAAQIYFPSTSTSFTQIRRTCKMLTHVYCGCHAAELVYRHKHRALHLQRITKPP